MAHPFGWSNYLQSNVEDLAIKSQAGMFNIILIFGPTRYGKSTLSFQIAKTISDYCKVPFGNENIELDAEKLMEVASLGKKHHVYVLDEGAFDLKGEDWQGKANKTLRKFFNTAAKYNQTFIINIPLIGSLHSDFVRDDHARGIRVNAQVNMDAVDPLKRYKRGYAKLYNNFLVGQWEGCKKKYPHSLLWKFYADTPVVSFNSNISFIDEEAYQQKKDEAIKKLGEDKKPSGEDKKRLSLACNYLHNEYKMSYENIGKVIKVSENTVGRIVRLEKKK